MQLQARLVHAEPGRRVVEVSAHRQGELLGSCLGEGSTAEEAEDRALARLQARLSPDPVNAAAAPKPQTPKPKRQPAVLAEPVAEPVAELAAELVAEPSPQNQQTHGLQPLLELPTLPRPAPAETPAAPAVEAPLEPPADPDDWSSELTQLDLQLKRLGWQREQENTYLERAFGHPSRSRLTSYGDLVAYLQALQALEPGVDPSQAPVPLRRRDLLAQCDGLLAQLQWDASQGRQFLERQFQVSSRQQLSDTQLLQFNMLLEGELIGV